MTNPENDLAEQYGIAKMLLRCGVSVKTKGFAFLSRAVYLCTLHRYRRISDLYSEIGTQFGCDEHTVHNYTDYALNNAKELCAFINDTLGTNYSSYRLNNKSTVILLAMCYTELKSKQGSD